MVSVSAKAWEAQKEAKMPRLYFDLASAKRYLERDQTPFTPALSVLYAMDKGLDILEEEGKAQVHARHAKIAGMIREGVKALGLELLCADERYASNTVTAVKLPEGVKSADFLKMVRTDHDIELATGQGPLASSIFRIGHLGWVTEEDAGAVLDALQDVLPKLGHKVGATSAR